MKQTAVEFIETELRKLNIPIDSGTQVSVIRIFEQAEQMEKENTKKLLEIIMWYDEESDVRPNTEIYNWFKQYYNETYAK